MKRGLFTILISVGMCQRYVVCLSASIATIFDWMGDILLGLLLGERLSLFVVLEVEEFLEEF